jgi:hypothetical protein
VIGSDLITKHHVVKLHVPFLDSIHAVESITELVNVELFNRMNSNSINEGFFLHCKVSCLDNLVCRKRHLLNLTSGV